MSDSKRESLIVTGFALIIIGIILIFFALSQPKVIKTTYGYVNETVTVSQNEQVATVASSAATFPVNLNTCTIDELMAIDGIGESKANAIIQYRDFIGGYTSVEQIKSIQGIGEDTYNSIAPYLCV